MLKNAENITEIKIFLLIWPQIKNSTLVLFLLESVDFNIN